MTGGYFWCTFISNDKLLSTTDTFGNSFILPSVMDGRPLERVKDIVLGVSGVMYEQLLSVIL